MQVMVKKWGNSASVRIPAAILQAARLKIDQLVEIREEGGSIVIEAAQVQPVLLAELIDGITVDNQHAEVDFGPPAGKELL